MCNLTFQCRFRYSPAGWDSIKKINILSEHLKAIQPEDAFDDHIVKPQLRKVTLNNISQEQGCTESVVFR